MKFILLFLIFNCCTSYAFPTHERIAEIQAVVDKLEQETLWQGVTFAENYSLPVAAMVLWTPLTWFQKVIQINPNILDRMSEQARKFVKYHEWGHLLLKHNWYINTGRLGSERLQDFEYEADIFATLVFKKFDQKYAGELLSFFSSMKHRIGPITIPSTQAKLCKAIWFDDKAELDELMKL